jgi:hypothetical protein
MAFGYGAIRWRASEINFGIQFQNFKKIIPHDKKTIAYSFGQIINNVKKSIQVKFIPA